MGPAAESYEAARRFKDQARGHSCPFDNHDAFFPRDASLPGAHRARSSTPTGQGLRDAFEAARFSAKANRDHQKKVGGSAPWDAPETAIPSSTYGGLISESAAIHRDTTSEAHADARKEAV